MQVQRLPDSSLTASFVYNAEGLRVRKTVNGVVTKYILHGKNITHLICGNDELHFFYDASGSPAMVEWNNGTTTAKYAYVKNLQGDIIAIIDNTGAEVVKYTYDAWGTPVSTSGTMAGILSMLQPFRYRGYVFDDETGLYYLWSRYYSPIRYRFLNADKSILNNLYTYCDNKPLNNIDITGCETKTNASVHKRHGPGKNYGFDNDIKKGTTVFVLFNYEDKNGINWSHVAYKNSKGYYSSCYVMSEFLDNSRPEASNADSDSDLFFIRTIKYGDKGIDVYNTQIMLSYLGLYDYNECDGVYGSKTYEAITQFQSIYMLDADWEPDPVDGLVGSKTKKQLIEELRKQNFDFSNCALFPNG